MKKEIEDSETIRMEAEAHARRHGVDAGRVTNILLKLAEVGWLAPNFPYKTALDDAILVVGPANSLDVFEQVDLVVLARRVTIFDYLNYMYTPFRSLRQLETLTAEFRDYLADNRDSLIQTGLPKTSFEKFLWMDWHLSTLYYTRPPSQTKMIRNDKGNYEYQYTWEDPEDPISYPSSFPRSDGRICGHANLSPPLTQDDSIDPIRIKELRPRLFDLKVDLLYELWRAVHYRVPERLWENCLKLLADKTKGLQGEEADFCIRLDHLYSGRTWREGENDYVALKELVLPGGGMSDILEVVGHIEAELTVGEFERTYSTLEDLVQRDSLGRPQLPKRDCYVEPGNPVGKKLDEAVDRFIALEKETDDFSRRFAYRVNQALEDEFEEIFRPPEIRLKRKVKRRFEPLVKNLQSYVESTGKVPRIDFLVATTDEEMHMIEEYDTLEITIPRSRSVRDTIPIRLLRGKDKSKEIRLSPMESSLLWLLAEERRIGETYWLSRPEKNKGVIRKIAKELELPPYFEEELDERPKNSRTWIWDFKNIYRKKLVSRINRKVNESLGISDRLIPPPHNVDLARKGIYFLAESIRHLAIPNS